MILFDEMVEVKWHSRNKAHFSDLGYVFTGLHSPLLVKTKHLQPLSNFIVKIECDYCGCIFPMRFADYRKRVEKNPHILKAACGSCDHLKREEVMLSKYGVRFAMQLDKFAKKTATAFKKSFEEIRAEFFKRGYELLSCEADYKNNKSQLTYRCYKHGIKTITYRDFHSQKECRDCYEERIRGSGSYLWQGGITAVNFHLREVVLKWKNNVMKENDYTCIITGKRGGKIQVHHLKGFNLLMKEVFEELNLPMHGNISNYSEEQLNAIRQTMSEKHTLNAGVCLEKEIHQLFHAIYGRGNNTPEQFTDFINMCKHESFFATKKENLRPSHFSNIRIPLPIPGPQG